MKDYIGDGVYVEFDGYNVWLKTERDGRIHEIALEPPVFDSLCGFVKRINENVSQDAI